MTYRGVVKGNTIILDEETCLPEGFRVAVTLEPEVRGEAGEISANDIRQRQELVARMKKFGDRLAGRNVNLGNIIIEERRELEKRA